MHEEPYPKAVTDSDVADIVRQLRELLQENGPSQEEDLLKALSPSQAQLILEAYGTLTAFLDQRPGFRVLHEDLYSFVYYEEPGDEDEESSCSSLVRDGATAVSRLACSMKYDSRRHYAVARDGRPRRARTNSSSSSSYESAMDGEEGDEENHQRYRMKDVCSQVPSRSDCQPRARQVARQTRDAEVQTQEWDATEMAELELTLSKREAEIAKLKQRLKNLDESHAREMQKLRMKVVKLIKRPPSEPLRSAAKVKSSRTTLNDRKPTATDGACIHESAQPRLRRLLRQRSPPPRPKPEDKPRAQVVDPRPRPVPALIESKLRRTTKRPPVPEFPEVPERKRQAAAPGSDIQCGSGRCPTKTKTELLISKTVEMIKKKQPNYTDQEIRRRVDQLRRTHGGFSGMTFNAIVALMLGQLKGTPQPKR